MQLTLQIQLLPDTKQARQMRSTLERFNAGANFVAEVAHSRQIVNKLLLQKHCYTDLREKFGLSSQMACLCVHRVAEAYKRDRTIKPKFSKHAAMTCDPRTYNVRSADRISLLTLDGRIIVPFVMGRYQRERFTLAKKQADLVLRKDGRWFFLVTVDLPEGSPIPATDFLGVDLGTTNLAVDSDGETFTGADVEACRSHYAKKKAQLQRKAANQKRAGKRPLNVRRKLKALSGRERRFKKNTNHVISKRLVEKCKDTNRGMALEDLSGIRSRTRFRSTQRDAMSKWAFAELRVFVEYKARLSGIEVVAVNPRNTSRTCSLCGHSEKANRQSRNLFLCRACGHFDHADYNAARNIRLKALVSEPNVSEHVLVA